MPFPNQEGDETTQDISQESDEQKTPDVIRKSRQRFPRVAAAMFSLFSSFTPESYVERESIAGETKENVSEESSAHDVQEDIVEAKEWGTEETIEWKGQAYSEEAFNDVLLAGFHEILGSLADKCDDAEQCFYYYADQLRTDAEPISLLTGKSPQELEWIGGAIRRGFAQQPGLRFPGAYIGIVETANRTLPPMPQEQKHAFFQDAYTRHLDTLTKLYENFGVAELEIRNQKAFQEAAATVIEKATELAAFEVQAQNGVQKYDNFEEWFEKGVAEIGSGEQRLRQAYEESKKAIETFYSFAGSTLNDVDAESFAKDKERAFLNTEQAYHAELHDLFSAAREKAEGKLFAGEEVVRWKNRADQEEARLKDIMKALSELDRIDAVASAR